MLFRIIVKASLRLTEAFYRSSMKGVWSTEGTWLEVDTLEISTKDPRLTKGV